MKPKVLFVIFGIQPGGLELYLYRFLEFTKGKINANVFCRYNKYDTILYNDYIDTGATITIQPLNYFNPVSLFKFYFFLRKNKFDSVCDFSGNFAGVTLFISKLAGIKRRITFYRESKYQFITTYRKELFLWGLKKLLKISATKYLSNSKEAFNNFQPNWKERNDLYKVIYNGISKKAVSNKNIELLQKQLNIPKGSFVVGHVGRYTPAKNHRLIIQVAKYFNENYPNVYFVLFGRGVKEGLYNDIKKYGLVEKVLTPGPISNVFEAHHLFDVFLYPSLNEGQPNALLEVMFSKLPIVASDIPSHRESNPDYIIPNLVKLTDLNGFINAIERVMRIEMPYDVEKLKKWAEGSYNFNKAFNEFLIELT
jgi:glycosyltransferase involved in cell wall biosynthesis